MREECSLSRTEAACMAGVGRGPNGIDELRALSANGTSSSDRWYTAEQFEREHVVETLEKLEQGDLDDEIWGKIILMEKCKRLAKAYLRRTTVIIDGSSDEYDGITLGFNHFESSDCDEASDEIRRKIGDGVIIKVDENGNVKAMARGLAPVIVQGWNVPTSKCISEQLVVQKGHLKTLKDRLKGVTDQQRVEKIFDMRLFNLAIERELGRAEPNAPELLLKTCIRVALVKDVGTNALKTPCWFMIVNLVALDVLRTKLPFLLNSCSVPGTLRLPSRNGSTIFSAPSTTQSTTTLNEIFPSPYSKQLGASGRLCESLPVLHQIQQLMQLANTIEKTSSQSQNSVSVRRRRSLSCSDSEDLPVALQKTVHGKKQHSQPKDLTLSSESSSGVSSMDLMKNFEKVEKWCKNSSKFLEQHNEEDLEDEGIMDISSSEHKSTTERNRLPELPAPKLRSPYAYRKPLTSDLFLNNINDTKDMPEKGEYQNTHCIRISDNDDYVKEDSKQASRERFEGAKNETKTRNHYPIFEEQNPSPYRIVEIVQHPRQLETQPQTLDRSYGPHNSKAISKNVSQSAISVEEDFTSHQNPRYPDESSQEGSRYPESRPLKPGKISFSSSKHPEFAVDEGYTNHNYLTHPEKESNKTRKKYRDNLYDARKYSGRHFSGMSRVPLTGCQRSKSQNYLLTELPPDYPEEANSTTAPLRPFDHGNVTKKMSDLSGSDTLNVSNQDHYPEKVYGLPEKAPGTAYQPYISEVDKGKKSRFKNMLPFSRQLLKSMGGGMNSQYNSYKPAAVQQNSRYPTMYEPKPTEVPSRAQQPHLVRMEPVVHSVPIIRQKQQQGEKSQYWYLQKPTISEKFTGLESRHTPDIFMNPVYGTTVPTTSGFERRSQPTITVPRWEAPAVYDPSWNSRRNSRIGAPYGSATLMPSQYSHYADNNRHSAKAFRRFN